MMRPINVDAYIATFQPETQVMLEALRAAIKSAAPNALEVISYAMPAYKMHKMLVYFTGYKNHIGFYPTSSGMLHFGDEFAVYKSSKGAVQFPLNAPLPLALIMKVVPFRVQEDAEKAGKK